MDNNRFPNGAQPGAVPVVGQPQPCNFEFYLRAPGQEGNQPVLRIQHLNARSAMLVALSQITDNPAIREIRIVKADSGIITP